MDALERIQTNMYHAGDAYAFLEATLRSGRDAAGKPDPTQLSELVVANPVFQCARGSVRSRRRHARSKSGTSVIYDYYVLGVQVPTVDRHIRATATCSLSCSVLLFCGTLASFVC